MRDAEAAEVGEDLLRELFEEGEVPGGVNDAGLPAGAVGGELLHVVDGGDAGEALAEVCLREAGVFNGGADVAGGLAGPDDVAEYAGGVVEAADLKAGIVGGGDKGVGGAERGAEDAELGVSLFREPIEAGADVDDGLAAGVDGAAEVGGDGEVGALKLSGAADVVVWLGQAKGGDAEAVRHGADGVVGEGVGVPLRHDDDGLFGAATLLGWVGGVPAGIDLIVFRVRGGDGGGEAEELGGLEFVNGGEVLELGVLGQGFGADVGGKELGMPGFETEVGGGLIAEKVGGVGQDAAIEGDHRGEVLGLVSGETGVEPVETVLEGSDDAVGVAGGKGGLPAEHPVAIELREHTRLVYVGLWERWAVRGRRAGGRCGRRGSQRGRRGRQVEEPGWGVRGREGGG